MIPIRQSTAFETAIGPVLDADGVAVTNCVVGDFKIKKTTGNFAALNASATLTHVSAGTYDLVLTTSDTDTVGLACIAIDDTTNACAPLFLQVMEEAVYDALYAASANAWAGAAGSTTLGTGAITAAVIADGAIDAATFAADVDAEARGWLGLASANLDTQLADIPTVAEFEARTILAADYLVVGDLSGLALESTLTTIAGYIDTEIQTIITGLADVPTVAEFEARTLLAADYTVVADLGVVQTADHTAALTTIEGKIDTADTAIDSVATTTGVAGAGLTEAGGTGDHLTALATQVSVNAIAADLPTRFTKAVAISNFTWPMVDTDDVLATGLTVTGSISKEGGTFSALGGTIAEVGGGLYKIDTISGTETNANQIVLKFSATGAKDRLFLIATQPT